LFIAEGFDVAEGLGSATDGDEGGEKDFDEGMIDIADSPWNVDFWTAVSKVRAIDWTFLSQLSSWIVLTKGFLTLFMTCP